MAIRPSDKYPGQIDSGVTGWPHGKARNDLTENDGTGTPMEAAWLSDLWGFEQSLLDEAGINPSGNPDKVGASQYLEAIQTIINDAITNPQNRLVIGGAGVRVTGPFDALALNVGDQTPGSDANVEVLRVVQSMSVYGTLAAYNATLGSGNNGVVNLASKLRCVSAGRLITRGLGVSANTQIYPSTHGWIWVDPAINGARSYQINDSNCEDDLEFGVTNSSGQLITLGRPSGTGPAIEVPAGSWAICRRVEGVWEKAAGSAL